ncbi:MAG: cupin domain-containing protein [Candidatus Thorarchaeota archaeon]|jgi:mannose-6-phosphate isomerase-like protein (cupin superfamily)
MVKIYRVSETELKGRLGYGVRYVADLVFKEPLDSAGFIIVKIPPEMKTFPHSHGVLSEAFVIMSKTKMGVAETLYDLNEGDVVVVEPGEFHWFETPPGTDVNVIAVKMPNLKDDKIEGT